MIRSCHDDGGTARRDAAGARHHRHRPRFLGGHSAGKRIRRDGGLDRRTRGSRGRSAEARSSLPHRPHLARAGMDRRLHLVGRSIRRRPHSGRHPSVDRRRQRAADPALRPMDRLRPHVAPGNRALHPRRDPHAERKRSAGECAGDRRDAARGESGAACRRGSEADGVGRRGVGPPGARDPLSFQGKRDARPQGRGAGGGGEWSAGRYRRAAAGPATRRGAGAVPRRIDALDGHDGAGAGRRPRRAALGADRARARGRRSGERLGSRRSWPGSKATPLRPRRGSTRRRPA